MSRPRAPAPILLTGFAPFGPDAGNPSWELARALRGTRIGRRMVQAARLPVEFGAALEALDRALDRHAPVLVLCLGLAGGRSEVSLERVAINVDDARIPDNAGHQPVDVPVVPGGPAAYFSSLPIKAMCQAMRQAGCPAGISQSAGTYVCNHVFYGLMHRLAQRPGVRGGFMHVPYSPALAARHPQAPSLAPETVVPALRKALAVALRTRGDLAMAAGAEH